MDLKVMLTTFVTIFVAELGDKTQMAAIGLGATHSDWKAVATGTALALILAALMGVLAGKLLGNYVEPKILRLASGSIFVFMGLLLILDKMPR